MGTQRPAWLALIIMVLEDTEYIGNDRTITRFSLLDAIPLDETAE